MRNRLVKVVRLVWTQIKYPGLPLSSCSSLCLGHSSLRYPMTYPLTSVKPVLENE